MQVFRSVTGFLILGIMAITLFGVPPLRAADEQNVFPEGSFESVPIDPGGQTGWWGVTGDKVKIVEKNGQHWLRLENRVPGQSAQTGRRFPLNPDWGALTIKARLRTEAITVGKNPWETPKIDFEMLDANQQSIPTAAATIAVTTDTPWKEFTAKIAVPANAAYLHIVPSLWMATGVLEVDDLQMFAEKRQFDEPEEDATLPASEKLRWGEEPVEIVSAKREQIVLNGIWQFVPLLDTAETKPPGGMAYIRVPGSWQPDWPLPGLVSERGKGPAWRHWGNGSGTSAAWYQRRISVPARWAGRAVILSLQRVSTDAIVYVNGTKCGDIRWPSGEVDISKALKAGEEATLSILVMATTEGNSEMFLDPGRVVTRAAALESKGLIGDVLLSSRPQGAHISDVFVQTSTRKKQLKLNVELSDASAGPVQFVAKLIDGNGKEETRFHTQARLDGTKKQTVQLSWVWDKPRLWDFRQPNLYTLRLEARGTNLDDEYAQSFGFREFWIEGRKFFLNGSEIHLRPTSHTWTEHSMSGFSPLIDAHIEGAIRAGFNAEEQWPIDLDEKGKAIYRELWAERADRKGFLLLGTALNMDRARWGDAGYRESWGRELEQDLRRYRNHPSIIIWTTNPNWLGHGLDQDPRYIGRQRAIPDQGWKQSAAIAREGNAVLKRLDPTRPVLNHAGSSVGDIYNINCYLNFMPLQEREEWLSEWSKSGDMPLMCAEFGTPWRYSFMRGRWGMDAGTSEPLMTEYCAIYLGPEAYALESPAYRQAIKTHYRGGMAYADWTQEPVMDFDPAHQKLQALFTRNTYRSWRTAGISGGMIPWDYGYGWDMFWNERRRRGIPDEMEPLGPFKPGTRGLYVASATQNLTKPFPAQGRDIYPAGVALREANGPTLAWIAGGQQAFTAKDHSFSVGQNVEKQVILINDQRAPQPFHYTWSVQVSGKQVAKHSGKGRIGISAKLSLPLRFKIPAIFGTPKAAGTITLTARIGTREHRDVFAFRAFAKPIPLRQTVTLYDPAGKTAKMLAALGLTVQEWKGPPASGLIVIGREALSRGKPLPFDLEATLRTGGRVLVMAQDPKWLQDQLGFRVTPCLSRRIFPVSRDHPALQNLDAADLSDWAGVSTLVDAYPEASLQNPAWRSPIHGWHWGNRGAVASTAVEKPHRSGWRPILECEFDLAYSPLMELDYGQGHLILSTLDLEDHVSQDSAAALLARNLIRYAAAAKPAVRAKRTILVGGENDQKTLDSLGVMYQTASHLEADADLVIIGRQGKYDDSEVRRYLERGGKVLFLARDASDHGLGVTREQSPAFAGSLRVPAWPECQGLSASDLRWRTEASAWLLKAGTDVGADGLLGRLQVGKGVALFSQIDPDELQAETNTYFRITRWRQTRTLSQLLANLGASFSSDRSAASLTKPEMGYYVPDYRLDFEQGDDPYRYFRW